MNKQRGRTGAHLRSGVLCAAMLSSALLGGMSPQVSPRSGSRTPKAAGKRLGSQTDRPETAPIVDGVSAVTSGGSSEAASAAYSQKVSATGGVCPCSLWDDSTGVLNPDGDDRQQIEVGVKFRSDVDGFVSGLRFYKGSNNVGVHVGHLWSASGTQLAQATFEGESASGWQEVTLSAPVAISANTTYVASYHSSGVYAFDRAYFTSEHATLPLRALQDGADGANGVYHHGPSGFPTDQIQSTNFWVDIVFQTSITPDTTAPAVTATTPAGGAANVAITSAIVASASEALSNASISNVTVKLRDSANNIVAGTIAYDNPTRTITIRPSPPLLYSTTYTATISGGAGGVTDTAGNPLPASFIWSFTTVPAPSPPPNEGPGGPILIVSSAANPFTRYYTEILRGEGLNEFTATDITNLSPALLAGYDVVLLGEMPLTSAQVTVLSDWVNGGGNLVAMRPDKKLAPLLGLSDAGSAISDGYIQVDTSAEPGQGIVGQTMQFHGIADRYTLGSAASVATLFTNATTSSSNPAVTLRVVGASGGHAAAFTYDLARSVVYTRQGNPLWAGQDRDGSGPIRSDDLFFGAKIGDVQPDWLDFNRVQIPQADEQQRLLANLIQVMNRLRKPLPHFWYLPRGLKATVVMTGDDHASGGTSGQFDRLIAASPAGCSLGNWECLRSTSYIYVNTPLSDSAAAGYVAQGFEVADHLTTSCVDFTSQSALSARFDVDLSDWRAKYVSLPSPVSNRTHCMAWSDWGSEPKVELAHGIRFDTTYYYFPSVFVQDRPGLFTGSGLPMRFADVDGSAIDVYQAATQITDESGMNIPTHIAALLDNATGPLGYYGVFTMNMHTDLANHPGANAIVAAAQARSIPVVSSKQMLDWIDGRNASSFSGVSWSANALSFVVNSAPGATGLEVLVPTQSAAGTLSGVSRGGSAIPYTTEVLKGIEYARFTSTSGSYVVTYGLVLNSTTTTLSTGPNPSIFNQSVTLQASVSPLSATGMVEFREGAAVLGSSTLSGGSASVSTSALAIGSHGIQATYLGDANYSGSPSSVVTQQVNAAAHLVSSVSPNHTCQNGPALTVDLAGSGFLSGSSARWNGSGLTTRFVSATQLQADLSTSEVSAPGASTITVNDPFGNAGVSSVPFTVDADETPPVVTAPGSTTAIQSMCSGGNGGTDAASDPAIAAFLAGGTGADECSASTTHLVAQVGGADVTATTFFPAGTTSVAFRFSDASGNVGSATSNLTVRLFGDLNLDGVADASDLVIFSNYVVHNLNAGTPPFLAPAAMADLNGDGFGDSLDLVILSNYAVHNIPCLPQP